MVGFRVKHSEEHWEVSQDGAVKKCIQCGDPIHFIDKDESRNKCRSCVSDNIAAKEMYFSR